MLYWIVKWCFACKDAQNWTLNMHLLQKQDARANLVVFLAPPLGRTWFSCLPLHNEDVNHCTKKSTICIFLVITLLHFYTTCHVCSSMPTPYQHVGQHAIGFSTDFWSRKLKDQTKSAEAKAQESFLSHTWCPAGWVHQWFHTESNFPAPTALALGEAKTCIRIWFKLFFMQKHVVSEPQKRKIQSNIWRPFADSVVYQMAAACFMEQHATEPSKLGPMEPNLSRPPSKAKGHAATFESQDLRAVLGFADRKGEVELSACGFSRTIQQGHATGTCMPLKKASSHCDALPGGQSPEFGLCRIDLSGLMQRELMTGKIFRLPCWRQ